MDDIYVYFAKLPSKVNEVVTPCLDGYTIYLNDHLDEFGQIKAYNHAIHHIYNDDYSRVEADKIEADAHFKKMR
jgi:hypothetical protein